MEMLRTNIAFTSPEFWQLKSHYFRDPVINAVSLSTFHGNLHISAVFSRLCDLHYQSILEQNLYKFMTSQTRRLFLIT